MPGRQDRKEENIFFLVVFVILREILFTPGFETGTNNKKISLVFPG